MIIERQDQQQLSKLVDELSEVQSWVMLMKIVEQVCWHGDVNREWLLNELEGRLKKKVS